ncbi:MAG: hypothetical protein AMXMBFR36_17940 [Acidobacteriota bacterium]
MAPEGGQATTQRVAAVVLLAAATVAIAGTVARGRDLARLEAKAAAVGLAVEDGGALDRALTSAEDPAERRLALARALLAAAVRPENAAAAERTAERLAAAGELARAALDGQPASAEAAEIAGAALALEWLARRDQRLLTERERWRAWLDAAANRRPASPSARAARAAAELEILPALAGDELAAAERRLAEAFAEPDFLRRAYPRWLELAGSVEAAARLLPDRAEAWALLQQSAIARGELESAGRLRERARAARRRELAAELDALAASPRALPPRELDRALAELPLGLDFAPLVERAMTLRPAGPGGEELARAAARWIEWAEPLCLLGDCPLAAGALGRLAGAHGLAPELAAFAALAAGDEVRAGRLARRADARWSEEWGPFLLLEARRALDAGNAADARERLGRVHRSARSSLAGRRLARALGGAGALEATAAVRWEPSEWTWTRGRPALALDAGHAAPGLAIGLARPARRATLVGVEWDGRPLPAIPVEAGAEAIELEIAVTPGPHLLRLEVVAGESPATAVTTLGRPPSTVPRPTPEGHGRRSP